MATAVALALALSAGTATCGDFLGEPFVVGTDAAPPAFGQLSPSISFNPDRGEYLVVWYNDRPAYPDIQAQRVGIDGSLVGGPFYIAGGPGAARKYPDVVYNPTNKEFLVVWQEVPASGRWGIRSQRVGGTGLLVGPANTLSSGPEVADCMAPAVAYASTSNLYMVVWERLVQGSTSSDIEAQVLTGTAAAVGGNFVVVSGTATVDNTDPDIGYNRSRNEYLIVWTRNDLNASVKDVWGRITTRDGVLLGAEFYIGYHTADDEFASVVGTPTAPGFGGYYVVWTMEYSAGDFDIYGREVGWDGLLTPYQEISTSSWDDGYPAVAYDEAQDRLLVAVSRLIDPSVLAFDVVVFPFIRGTSAGSGISSVGGESMPLQPAVASGVAGNVLVSWNDYTDPYLRDVYGRIWSSTAVFVDGFEGGDCDEWSQEVP